MSAEQISIPATIIRGGTSRGIFLLEKDLPEDRALWGLYLIELLGSRSGRQIDGLGGADSTTSKVCILGPNDSPDVDVTYTFAQVGIGEEKVYWDMNCGNLSSAVGTFAILSGLVPIERPITKVRVYQANTHRRLNVEVPVGADGVLVDGTLAIGGVPGTGAPVAVDFSETVGASIGRGLFPTGNRIDTLAIPGVGDIECTIMDLANMCVFFNASDLGLSGVEGTAVAAELAPRYSQVRFAAQDLLGISHESSNPWPVSVAGPSRYESSSSDAIIEADSYDVAVRLTGLPAMRDTMHPAFPTTGASCLSVAAVTDGTIVNEIYTAGKDAHHDGVVNLGHPSGVMRYEAQVLDSGSDVIVARASAGRTVRLIMEGKAYLRVSELKRLDAEIPLTSATRADVPIKADALAFAR